MTITKKGTVIELDIHGMYEDDAKREIERYLSTVDQKVQEVIVIHGYHKGQVLKNMVRTRLKHPRIASKLALKKTQSGILADFDSLGVRLTRVR